MNETKEFPKLFATSSKGKVTEWQVKVEDRGDHSVIIAAHGYQGGTIQVAEKNIYTGKNIGKANETTHFEQALSEAQSTYNKKIDKKYAETLPDATQEVGIPLPTLAHSYTKRSHDINWEAGVGLQPKLDGVRCLAAKMSANTMRYTSRTGKEFNTLDLFSEALLDVLDKHDILDGEIYTQAITFQELVGAVKRESDTKNREHLEYHVYDFASHDGDFKDRLIALRGLELADGTQCRIKIVETHETNDPRMLQELHRQFLQQGYEGTMIRNMLGKYMFKHRSKDLQKYKDFVDEEYEIIGGHEGTGSAEGQCTFTCITADEKEFNVRPKGTNAQRKEMWENLNDYVGKHLTVRYQELTDDGIPRFPVGITVRDYE